MKRSTKRLKKGRSPNAHTVRKPYPSVRLPKTGRVLSVITEREYDGVKYVRTSVAMKRLQLSRPGIFLWIKNAENHKTPALTAYRFGGGRTLWIAERDIIALERPQVYGSLAIEQAAPVILPRLKREPAPTRSDSA